MTTQYQTKTIPSTAYVTNRIQIWQLSDHYIVDTVSNKITDTAWNYIIGLSIFLWDKYTTRPII